MPGRLADWRRKLLNAQTIPGIILGIALGAAVGVGGYTFVYAKGGSYLPTTRRPAPTATSCRSSTTAGSSRATAPSRSATTATRRPGCFGKYTTKASNGFWHSFYFTSGSFHEPIQITPRNHG